MNKCRNHTVEINYITGQLYCPYCNKIYTDDEALSVLLEILGPKSAHFTFKMLKYMSMYVTSGKLQRKKIRTNINELTESYLLSDKF